MICERARSDRYTQIKKWKVVLGTYTRTSVTKVRMTEEQEKNLW